MTSLHARGLVDQLHTLESVALIPRVTSTNAVGRRIVNECIENQLLLPKAILIAREQLAGIGRNARKWSSPAGKGIYATTLFTVPVADMPLVPLQIANIVVSYLRHAFGIDARIKWPNDILVDRRKIAGILIEARIVEESAYLLIGIGINVEPFSDEGRANATTVRESTENGFGGIDDATSRFILHLDARLGESLDRGAVFAEWNRFSIHAIGDAIECVVAGENVCGAWAGLDEHGRALLRHDGTTTAVSAGDLILS